MLRSVALLGLIAVGCTPAAAPNPVAGDREAPKPGAADRIRPTRTGSDWSRFLGPNGDASTPETGIRTDWTKVGLRKLWECDLGVGYAPPTVAAGRLFHFDRFGENARLTCRNAETGEAVWTFEYPMAYEDLYGYDPGPRACPVVDDDRVYTFGVEGMLHCLSVADGKPIWKVDTRNVYHVHQNFFGAGSAPVVEGELLIAAIGGSPKGPRPIDLRDAVGNGSTIVAFDKRTGAEKYRVGDDLASYSSPVVVTLGGQRVGLYFARGGLLGFDPNAGTQLFRFPWRAKIEESVNAANPVVVGDRILLTECYEKGTAFVKILGGAVTKIWTDADKGPFEKALLGHWCTPIHDGGFVYGCSGRHANEGELRCVDLATGDVAWRERRTTRCTLVKVDGHILSLGEAGELRLFKLNPEKYEEIARWEVSGISYPAWAPPVISRGRMYIRGKDENRAEGHHMVCLELMKK